MARIRSLHPGIYTDEAWASVSLAARWLGMGLCTESDDNGVFEWKPVQIKMRVFPADTVSVPDLLSELLAAGIVQKFDDSGKPFGAIRNFCKYQRPRKPKAWFPLPDDMRAFVGFGVQQKSELDNAEDDPAPPKSEKPPQMEDGGCSSEPIGSDAGASPAPVAYIDARAELFGEGKPALLAMNVPAKQTGAVIGGWLKQTGDDCRRVLEAIQRARDQRVMDPLSWISAQLGPPRGRNVKSAPSPVIQAADDLLAELRGGGGAREDEGASRQLRQR